MLLAIDIGNTRVKLGLFDGPDLVADFQLRADRERTPDEYAVQLSTLLSLRGQTPADVDAAAMACVVPRLGETLREFARRHLRCEPLVVRAETNTGLRIRYDPPSALGPDRLVNAVAAWTLWGAPENTACVVVDYGTATKLEAVSREGEYLGGAILPGIGISLDALFDRAALLRRVDLHAPPAAAIGANTADALRSGILLGYAAQTDGLVRRFFQELGGSARVIATGGIAPLIAPHAETIAVLDPHLTLTGLRLIHERAARAGVESVV